VLVLRYFEDMSEEQIADTLGLAPGTVKSYASKGLAKLRVDPTLGILPVPEDTSPPAGTERLVAVHERIKHRRERVITVATAVVVVLTIVLVSAITQYQRNRSLPPTRGGFPEYLHGYHVVAADETATAKRATASVTWTPTTLDMSVFFKCTHEAAGKTMWGVARINGTAIASVQCDAHAPFVVRPNESHPWWGELQRLGAETGRPVTITVAIESRNPVYNLGDPPVKFGKSYVTQPPGGRIAAAVGEAVPFDRYELPAPPGVLAPLAPTVDGGPTSFGFHADGPHQYTTRWMENLRFYARSQTPGQLTIRVNGIAVQTLTWWDYDQAQQTVDLTSDSEVPGIADLYGKDVTIAVQPEHMTGDWWVYVGPA
jgi:hypothetical protein